MIHCPHAERCGGCSLIALAADAQQHFKRSRVERSLAPYSELAKLPIQVLEAAQPEAHYRTRAKLVVSREGQIGLFTRNSHAVVDIPECQVLTPALAAIVGEVRKLLADASAVPITGLDAREVKGGAEPGVLLTLIGPASERPAIEALAERLRGRPQLLGVAFGAREPNSPQLLGETPEPLWGPASARDALEDGGPYHYAAHGGFAQVHRGQATRLVACAIAQLSAALGELRGARILELYAGAGALALRLLKLGAQPTLVERFEPALQQVARAAREQGLPEPQLYAADAEHALTQLMAAGARFDAVLVNPPRRGLPAALRARLLELAPRALVYVSCEPERLARDLADFSRRGLRPRTLTPFDMLPLAADVESVVLLQPAAAPPVRVLYEDEGLLAVDKPPHLPTVPQREHAASLLEQLQRERGEALRPIHRLDAGTSGVCLFAKSAAAATAYAAQLAEGQKHYLALVRGKVHDKGIVRKPLPEDGKLRDALTRYTRKSAVSGHSLLRVRPAQGRTHQVRRHLAAIGHPVLGDARYGDVASNRHFEHRHGLDRTFLHLLRVELRGGALVIEAPLAPDLEAVLRSLRGTALPARRSALEQGQGEIG
ncbi:MAG TPA: pseudouridine synthase [Polyangiales bacterium]|nr:pseudouridine synthase [Polyangiales bacterium]